MIRALITFIFLLAIACSCSFDATKHKYVSNGDRLFANGKYGEAAKMYQKALSIDPRFAPAYYGRGRSLERLENFPEAEGAFRRALELLPPGSAEHQDAEVQLAYVLLHIPGGARMDEIEKAGVELCRRDPNSYDGRRLLGELAMIRARSSATINVKQCESFLDEALVEYRIAKNVRPDDAAVALGFARSLAVKGLPGEAEQVYRAALQNDKTRPEMYSELYRLLIAQEKFADAEQVLRDGICNVPSHQGFAVMLATQALATDPARALPFIEQLKVAELRLPAANLIAGDFYVRAAQLDRAKEEYRRSIAAKQFEHACRARLIQIAMFQNSAIDLTGLVQEMLKINSADPVALVADAVVKMKAGDTDTAERELQSALASDLKDPNAPYHLARLELQRGHLNLAKLSLQTALQRKPGFIPALLMLAQVQFASREYRDAQKSAEEVLASRSDNTQARIVLDAAKAVANRADQQVYPRTMDAVMNGLYSGASGVATESRVRSDPSAPQEIYLKDSVCDAALAAFNKLRARDYARFDLAAEVPGVWSPEALARYLGN